MIVEFNCPYQTEKNIVFCCLDITNNFQSAYPLDLVKNISDFTISNLIVKGFNVLQGLDEDALIKKASDLKYEYAVVFATGTEFINGFDFFSELKKLTLENFFIAGHILDREDAFYELHYQCYVVNLKYYKKLKCPPIGSQRLGEKHKQNRPWRSKENYHDTHTPIWVSGGDDVVQYKHKCHGWNILQLAFEKDLPVVVFNEKIRSSKKFYYPELNSTFDKHVGWINWRYNYCANSFIHKENSEESNLSNYKFQHLILPASGMLYSEMIDNGMITFYDYNLAALDYYKTQTNNNPNYRFVHIDLLSTDSFDDLILEQYVNSTFINLSNIFCYEGTASHISLRQRLYRENCLIEFLKNKMPESYINFTGRAAEGYGIFYQQFEQIKNLKLTEISNLKKPTWHINNDWQ